MVLDDTVLYVGYSDQGIEWVADSIEYNGRVYTVDHPRLEYQKTAWKFLPGFTFKGGAGYAITKGTNVYMNVGILTYVIYSEYIKQKFIITKDRTERHNFQMS